MPTPLEDQPNSPPPRGTLDAHDDAQMRSWAQRFGVTVEELQDAVRTVGNEAELVQQFLQGGGNRVP